MLDQSLAKLAVAGMDSLPLSIRRFAEYVGVENPVDAIEIVTDNLLKEYYSVHSKGEVIRAQTLCQICGIGLRGKIPRVLDPVYSVSFPARGRNSAFGRLRFRLGKPEIVIPNVISMNHARIAVAHEIGHFLIHKRDEGLDRITLKIGSSDEEESIAQYAARLLLLPDMFEHIKSEIPSLPEFCVTYAGKGLSTVHASSLRIGDRGSPISTIRCVVLWGLSRRVPTTEPVSLRLTPKWFACRDFIPVGRCHAGSESLIAELAGQGAGNQRGYRKEAVSIGSFIGHYGVDAFAWGDIAAGTRLVLSFFLDVS